MDWNDLQQALTPLRGSADEAKLLGESLTAELIELLEGVRPGAEDPVLTTLLGEALSETARRTGWNSLVLNPGSTSTKAAIYSGTTLVAAADVHLVPGEPDGIEERVRLVRQWLDDHGLSLGDLSGIAARGGFVAPVPTGTYRISDEMRRDLDQARLRHASNMAVPMALELGKQVGGEVELTITDPVTCDEMEVVHRITGTPRILTDGSAAHYLNLRAVCTLLAKKLRVASEELHLAVVHMGGGSSAARYHRGRMVKVLPGFGALPSANRSGALPLKELIPLMERHDYTMGDLKRDAIESGGGLLALAGTNDFKAFFAFRRRGASPEQREKADLIVDFFTTRVAAGLLELSAAEEPLDAIVLTGGLAHDREFCDSVAAKIRLTCPVLRAPGTVATQALAAGLLRTCARSRSLTPYVRARDELRARHAAEEALLERPIFTQKILRRREGSPLRTIEELVTEAYPRDELPTIALCGAENEEAMLAARQANHLGAPRLARFVLLGPWARISQLAWELEIPIDDDNFVIVDTAAPVDHAVELLEAGVVDTMMKGSVTTAELLKGALRSLKRRGKLAPGQLLSHIALFEIPQRSKLVALTDAAINPNPDLASRLQILENALAALKLLGIERPKVAVLSATEKTSDRVASSVEGEKIAHQLGARRDLIVEGPISVDLALSPESAREKHYNGRIQGDADLLLAPNIDMANAVYKAFTITSGATVAASVVGGEVPLILTSRGDAARGKLASIALTLVLAREANARRASS